MNAERRTLRSHDPLVALHYQLTAARRRGAVDTLVVADSAGLLVAGAGAWASCEELAAFAPLLVAGGGAFVPDGEVTRLAELRGEVKVASIDLDGDAVLVCARGGEPDDLDATAEGVRRILRQAA